MDAIAVSLKIDGDHIADALQVAREQLNGAQGEVVLDFSAVGRIDPPAIQAMETLAGSAAEKSIKVGLRGVNVDVYKVLKLAKLVPRFSFLS